jgi:release factor glutamine methyltransferase
MKNSKVLFQEISTAITLKEKREEIQAIAFILLESLYGITRIEIMSGKIVPYPEETALTLQKFIERINVGEPVQYVVGEEYFFGRKFQVNPCVLIPRPETEELIRVVLSWFSYRKKSSETPRILDIGTGSGCIPITLFHEIGNAEVYATDISNAALSVAQQNAEFLQANITFIEHNILKERLPVTDLDIIVSNPPYVTERERGKMKSNVLNFEPHLALFVPDNDPLLFYREIAARAIEGLKTSGLLAVEINENYGQEVSRLFQNAGFQDVAIVNDISEKARIVRGVKPGLP